MPWWPRLTPSRLACRSAVALGGELRTRTAAIGLLVAVTVGLRLSSCFSSRHSWLRQRAQRCCRRRHRGLGRGGPGHRSRRPGSRPSGVLRPRAGGPRPGGIGGAWPNRRSHARSRRPRLRFSRTVRAQQFCRRPGTRSVPGHPAAGSQPDPYRKPAPDRLPDQGDDRNRQQAARRGPWSWPYAGGRPNPAAHNSQAARTRCRPQTGARIRLSSASGHGPSPESCRGPGPELER